MLELQGTGKIPTVDGIREILGTGSKTTIAQHLRDWRAKQADAQGELPHELMALVTGLWKRLHAQADQRITEVENTYCQQVQELKHTVAQAPPRACADLKNQLHQKRRKVRYRMLSQGRIRKTASRIQPRNRSNCANATRPAAQQLESFRSRKFPLASACNSYPGKP